MTTLEKIDNIKNQFGQRVKELRLAKGLTQDNLAFELGLESSRSIRKIEAGESFANLKTVSRLAKALEVEVKELFDF